MSIRYINLMFILFRNINLMFIVFRNINLMFILFRYINLMFILFRNINLMFILFRYIDLMFILFRNINLMFILFRNINLMFILFRNINLMFILFRNINLMFILFCNINLMFILFRVFPNKYLTWELLSKNKCWNSKKVNFLSSLNTVLIFSYLDLLLELGSSMSTQRNRVNISGNLTQTPPISSLPAPPLAEVVPSLYLFAFLYIRPCLLSYVNAKLPN